MENTNTQAVAEMNQAEAAAVLATYVAIPADDARYAIVDAASNAAPTLATGKRASSFETKACGRCGGSGNYSYCTAYGTRCFGCSGAGRVWTAKGKAAAAYFERLLSKPAIDVKIGDVIFVEAGPFNKGGFAIVKDAGWSQSGCTSKDASGFDCFQPYYTIDTAKLSSGILDPETTYVRVSADAATKRAALLAALEYQSTLTAKGTPAKRSRKAVAA
jgi:hypothetical protein